MFSSFECGETSSIGKAVDVGEEVELVVLRMDIGAAAVAAALRVLAPAERLRAERYAIARDGQRFAVGRAHLRGLLGSRLGLDPARVELAYGCNGKPALAGSSARSGLRFNCARSGDVAVLAFAYGRELGVDVEAVCRLRDADEIARRHFSRPELGAYLALDPADQLAGFYNCWTRKEAFTKALGDGLYHSLDAFDVSLAPGDAARILRVGELSGDECGWELHSFNPSSGVVGALVVQRTVTEAHPLLSSGMD
jgi:4'-phosphopantetheinyl transferase